MEDYRNAWMDVQMANRSLLLSDEEGLAGKTLVSMETEDLGADDFYVYICAHFADWLPVLRLLNKEQQEVMLSYYLLGKNQMVLGKLFSSTQTVMSFRLRMFVKLMGAYMMWGGPPDVETMERILIKAGCERKLKRIALSEVVALFVRCRNFIQIAAAYHLHPPDVRRAMSQAANYLLGGEAGDHGGIYQIMKVAERESRSPEQIALVNVQV